MTTQGRVWMSMAPPKILAPPESSSILAFPTKYPLPRKIRPPANHFEDRRWFIRREGGHIFTFVDMSENYTVDEVQAQKIICRNIYAMRRVILCDSY